MRMFKSLSLAALLGAALSVHAQDNAAQAAARAALLQKMQDMDNNQGDNNNNDAMFNQPAQPAAAPAKSAASTKKKSKPAAAKPVPTPAPASRTVIQPAQPAPPVQPQFVQPQPAAIPPLSRDSAASQAYTPNQDNDAQSTARAALMQKMQEMDVQDMNSASMNPSASGNEAIGVVPAGTVMASNPPPALEPFFDAPPMIVETPQQQQIQQQHQSGKRHTFVAFQNQSTQPQVDHYGFAPIQPPAAPVSSEKEVELRALLSKYRADLITPTEYQSERARILSGP